MGKRARSGAFWGETICPSLFWFVFYVSTLLLWLCLWFLGVCVCACVCLRVLMAGGSSACFLEYTLYLCPDWTPGSKHTRTQTKKNHCGTASGEINLEANKNRRHVGIVSCSSPQTITFQVVLGFFKRLYTPPQITIITSVFACLICAHLCCY